jgi:hypothetical protein
MDQNKQENYEEVLRIISMFAPDQPYEKIIEIL